jgi:hypothetical protein
LFLARLRLEDGLFVWHPAKSIEARSEDKLSGHKNANHAALAQNNRTLGELGD